MTIIKTLVELAQALEHDMNVQVKAGSDWESFNRICTFNYAKDKLKEGRIRIAPKLKAIDLSVLVSSGIDCDFSCDGDFSSPMIGKLAMVEKPSLFVVYRPFPAAPYPPYRHCQPRMNYWHSWYGDKCPLPRGLIIEARVLSVGGDISESTLCTSDELYWGNRYKEARIIAFKVTGLADGYCWPWEV